MLPSEENGHCLDIASRCNCAIEGLAAFAAADAAPNNQAMQRRHVVFRSYPGDTLTEANPSIVSTGDNVGRGSSD
jgi:hypothetical protein